MALLHTCKVFFDTTANANSTDFVRYIHLLLYEHKFKGNSKRRRRSRQLETMGGRVELLTSVVAVAIKS